MKRAAVRVASFIHPHYFTPSYRVLNFLGALLLLLLLAPFALLAWPLAILLIGRPIIFKQKRLGENGQIFTLYKLRSMVKNAEALRGRYHDKYQAQNQAPQPMFKISDDPRFLEKKIGPGKIKIGYFLSHSGLDELPQLLNIVKGEMNFVGPRPLPLKEAQLLAKKQARWQEWRSRVKPGIFSYWAFDQNRHRSINSWKNLEKKTLEVSAPKQVTIIIQVLKNQAKNLLK